MNRYGKVKFMQMTQMRLTYAYDRMLQSSENEWTIIMNNNINELLKGTIVKKKPYTKDYILYEKLLLWH